MVEAMVSQVTALEVRFTAVSGDPEEEKRRKGLLRYSAVSHFNFVLNPPQ